MADITVILTDGGNGTILVDGTQHQQIQADGLPNARAKALTHLREWAAAGAPVVAHIQEPSTSFRVLVHDNGKVEPVADPPAVVAPAPVAAAAPAQPIHAVPNIAPVPQVVTEVPLAAPVRPAEPISQPVAPPVATEPAAALWASAAPAEVPPTFAADAPAATRSAARAELRFTNQQRERPRTGMRGFLYSATGGHMNLGLSEKEAEQLALAERIRRPFLGHKSTGVLALKGGIGKSSTTIGVGLAIAELRGESPVAIDANPDSGDLAERALGEMLYNPAESRSITDIVRDIEQIDSLTTLSDYLHIAGRLHVVAGEQDPALSDALTAEDFLKVHDLLAKYYRIGLVDCGTGVSHPAMAGILSTVQNVVICSGYAVSGARRANAALTWLREHGYGHLADSAVIVITDKDQVSARVNRQAIEEALQDAARSLVIVPHDRKVADGDLLRLDSIDPATKVAYQRIAAAVVDGY
ncbi:MinD/ParA family protein [Microbacterium sp.]|uniref:MinD/ParA family ATP-binding protein n=1 Tax=Microbacterium sp. TaxID=51671 RepID=UPI0025F50A42|nr:MinD/ParA family protein [Microbacterium sp.]